MRLMRHKDLLMNSDYGRWNWLAISAMHEVYPHIFVEKHPCIDIAQRLVEKSLL